MLVLACESIWEKLLAGETIEPQKLDALNGYVTTTKSL